MKRVFAFIVGFFLFLFFPTSVYAVDCSVNGGPVFTLAGSCTFPGTVNGVDAGTGTTNTASLVVPNAVTLTIGNTQTISVGSMTVNPGGSVIIPDGGVIIINKPLWVSSATDADGDGVPGAVGGGNTEISATQPPGKERKGNYSDPASLDCNDIAGVGQTVWVSGSGYTDADGDGVTKAASSYNCFNNANVGLATKASIGTGTPVTIVQGSVKAQSGSDCNDTGTNAALVATSATCYVDSDNDDVGGSTQKTCITKDATCATATAASGAEGTAAANGTFASNNTDCNDTGANSGLVSTSATCYVDSDNDDYGSTTQKTCITKNATCATATAASGAEGTAAANGTFAANNTDCNDSYNTYNVTITGNNPVVHLKFEDNGLYYVKDFVGSHPVFQYAGDPGSTTGRIGSYARVVTDDDILLMANPLTMNGTYTIEAWFVSPLPAASGGYNTLTRGPAETGKADHHVLVRRSDMLLGGWDNTGGTGFKSSGYNISGLSNGWHHLTAVANGSTTQFYIDGNAVGSPVAWVSSSPIFTVGNFVGLNQGFGTIDDVRIYNYARSAAQIAEDINDRPYNFTQYSNDTDNDGYGTGSSVVDCYPRAQYGANSGDCNQTALVAEYVHYTHASPCYDDFDLDGYTNGTNANTTCLPGPTCTYSTMGSNLSGGAVNSFSPLYRLKETIGSGTDCNDAGTNANQVQISASCYQDADNDDYGNDTLITCIPAGTTCATAVWGSGGYGTTAYNINHAANTSDCCDNNASASPAQTGWFTTTIPAGCHQAGVSGTFDWNCSGVVDKLYSENGTCYYSGGCQSILNQCVGASTCGQSCTRYTACTRNAYSATCDRTQSTLTQQCH